MGNYHNLDNEEIVFLYLQNKRYLEAYQRLFKEQGFYVNHVIPGAGPASSFEPFRPTELATLKKSKHYHFCKAIDEKLSPIVELIRESFPGMYSEIEIVISKPDF